MEASCGLQIRRVGPASGLILALAHKPIAGAAQGFDQTQPRGSFLDFFARSRELAINAAIEWKPLARARE